MKLQVLLFSLLLFVCSVSADGNYHHHTIVIQPILQPRVVEQPKPRNVEQPKPRVVEVVRHVVKHMPPPPMPVVKYVRHFTSTSFGGHHW